MARRLNEKQRRFVEAYAGEAAGNATTAARLAGYSGNTKSLQAAGSRLLSNVMIIQALERISEGDPLVATRKDRQRFWTEVMEGRKKAGMKERLKASELLGKSQRDFIERREHVVIPHESALDDLE